MVHAATASLLLGTAGWAINELQHKFTIGLAWYILVGLHSMCLLFLFGKCIFQLCLSYERRFHSEVLSVIGCAVFFF